MTQFQPLAGRVKPGQNIQKVTLKHKTETLPKGKQSMLPEPTETKIEMPTVKTNLSPERIANLKQIGGRIIPENEEKLREAQKENAMLKKVHQTKVAEKDKIYYKYCKAQSQFLDVMRELNRFRGDFNDCYSLRSKLITTQKVSKDIGKLITLNEDLLKSEKKVLNDF